MADPRFDKYIFLIDSINNLAEDKLLVIKCEDTDNRRLLHQFLESNEFDIKIFKTSLRIKKFPSEILMSFTKCPSCNKKLKVEAIDDYSRWEYRGICWDCDIRKVCYPFDEYDPDLNNVRVVWKNNCIIISNYLKNYAKPTHAKLQYVNEDNIKKIVNEIKIYEISAPNREKGDKSIQDDGSLTKQELQKYINNEIYDL